MALTRLRHISLSNLHALHRAAGSATSIYENRKDIRAILPDASERLVNTLQDFDEAYFGKYKFWIHRL